MSQQERLPQELKNGRGITPATAMREFGLYRLSARIHDLRQAGYHIITNMVTRRTRDGKKQVAEYRLK